MPILLVPGESDGVLHPSLVSAGATLPNVSLETVPQAGHWVPEQQPHAVVEKVRRFVASLS